MLFMDIFLCFAFGGYPATFLTEDRAFNNSIRVKLQSSSFLIYMLLFNPMFAYFGTRWSDWNWYYMFDTYATFFGNYRQLIIVFLSPFFFLFFLIGFSCTEQLIVCQKRRLANVIILCMLGGVGLSHGVILNGIFFYPGTYAEYYGDDRSSLIGFKNLEWTIMQFVYPSFVIALLLAMPYISVNPALIWDHTHRLGGLNWSGRFKLAGMNVVEPETEEEIVEIVKKCANEKRPVRAVGSMHSFVPTWDTGSKDGVTIRLHKYKQILRADANTGLVTVQAGLTLHEGSHSFDLLGLSPSTLGTVGWQTISGAISTGTHGPGLDFGSVGTMAVGFRIVLASGEVKEVNEGDDLFDAVGMSLGMLGILSTVTLKLVPKHLLKATEFSLPFDNWCEQYLELCRKHKFIRCCWTPASGNVDIMVMDEAAEDERGENDITKYWNRDSNTTWLLFRLSAFMVYNFMPKCLYPVLERLQGSMIRRDGRVSVDRSFEILNIDMNLSVRHDECELAVPFDRAVEACRVLNQYFKSKGDWPDFFVEIRPTAKDQFWLSPSIDGPVVYLDFFYYFFGPFRNKKGEPMSFFKRMTDVLEDFSPRPHWGKFNTLSPAQMAGRFPGLPKFLELRQKLDPDRLFANAYFDEYFDECYRSAGNMQADADTAPLLPA